MRIKYTLLLLFFAFGFSACGMHLYSEDGYTVKYYSKYRIVSNQLDFSEEDVISKGSLLQHREYFKVFYNNRDVIEQIKHYRNNRLHVVRHNDRTRGRLIRFEQYEEEHLLGYYINYYNSYDFLTHRKYFDESDKLRRVEKF